MKFAAHALAAAAAVLVAVAAGCSTPQRVARAPQPGEKTLRVVTWNVNYGLAGDPNALAILEELDADVVFLQETNEAWNAFLTRELRAKYPYIKTHACCGAGGLAVLSKTRIAKLDILDAVSWFPAARVVVDTKIGPVQALDVHLRPPFSDSGSIVSGYVTTPKIRGAEMVQFKEALKGDVPTLVVGDFNEESGPAVRTLVDAGFTDALPEFDKSSPTWHWPIASGQIDIKGRLDHVFTRDLEALDVHVEALGASDHYPVVAVVARR